MRKRNMRRHTFTSVAGFKAVVARSGRIREALKAKDEYSPRARGGDARYLLPCHAASLDSFRIFKFPCPTIFTFSFISGFWVAFPP